VEGVLTISTTESPRASSRPQEVRRKNFTVRLRGYDHGEVRSFLTGVGDDLERMRAQIERTQAQIASLTQDNDWLRAELDGARANPMEMATDQAVSVLNQAQQLADSLIDEAMQSARDLLLTARSQQRDVMEQAKTAAKGAVSRATAIAERAGAERAGGEDAAGRDVEYIRMFAKVAQVQFQAVLDALNEQVSRLGEVSGTVEPLRSGRDRETDTSLPQFQASD
jgi:DivIVA domain-containing protein